jgi:ABC-type antimicrobial peptide transport system permease subunit
VLGVPAALYICYLSANLLYGVKANNPIVYLASIAALGAAAAAAGFMPARRAASVDPLQALRNE